MASDEKLVMLFIPVYSNMHAVEELVRQIHSSSAEWLDTRVVANGSPAAVLAALRCSRIPFVELTENAGYGGAIQSAITTARTPYVAWMPGNLKITLTDFAENASRMIADRSSVLLAAKGLRIGRPRLDAWKTRCLSVTESLFARTMLRDAGAPPTIIARSLLYLVVGGPRDYGYDHWVLWRLITNNVNVRRFPIRYLPHSSVPSTWNRGMGDSLRMFVHLNREALRWRR
jgi:hypothetical protein